VHDLVIHPRDSDLVAATHGRSLYILDDISPLQQLSDDVLAADTYLFRQRTATLWRGSSRGATRGHMLFMGRNPLSIDQRPPGNSPQELVNRAPIHYYVKSAGDVTLEVGEPGGKRKHAATLKAEAGINRYYWNLRFDPTEAERKQAEERRRRRAAFAAEAAEESGPAEDPGGAVVGPGTYVVRLVAKGKALQTPLIVRDDPALLPPR